MKFIKFLFGILFAIILLLALAVGGIFAYTKIKYDVNIFTTISELTKINDEIDETTLVTNPYTQEDVESVQKILNGSTAGSLIGGDKDSGFSLNFDDISDKLLKDIEITDTQTAALVSLYVEENMNNEISFGNVTLPLSLLQIEFQDITEEKCDLDIIFKIDLKPLKETVSFPYTVFNNAIPNVIYVQSIINVTHKEKDFEYETSSVSIKLNNVEENALEDTLKIINIFADFGTAESLNLKLGNAIVDGLIGNDENEGLAYSLKDIGACDYTFKQKDNVHYFVIKRSLF